MPKLTLKEEFNQATKPLGGRLDLESLPEEVQLGYKVFLARARDLGRAAQAAIPALPKIHFDLVNSSKVNAVAFTRNGRYHIGITYGTLVTLRVLANVMLADRRNFVSIGHPEEELTLPTTPGFRADSMWIFANIGTHIPNGQLRREFARNLVDQALMFLLGHEIAHITLGHVDYYSQSFGIAEAEPLANRSSRLFAGKLDRQIIELEADRRAAYSRIHSIWTTVDAAKARNLPWQPSLNSVEGLTYLIFCGLHLVFEIFSESNTRNELEVNGYPSPSLRHGVTWSAALNFLARKEPEIGRPASDTIQRARFDTQVALLVLLGRPPGSGTPDPSHSLEFNSYLKKMNRRRRILKEEFSKYAYE